MPIEMVSQMVQITMIEVDRHPQIHGSRGQITCLGPILDPFEVHSGVLLAQNPLLWPIRPYHGWS